MKYRAEFEMKSLDCFTCPLTNGSDECELLKGDFEDTDEQVLSCPLIEVKPYLVSVESRRLPQVGIIRECRCGKCGKEIHLDEPRTEIKFCRKCGAELNWDAMIADEKRLDESKPTIKDLQAYWDRKNAEAQTGREE